MSDEQRLAENKLGFGQLLSVLLLILLFMAFLEGLHGEFISFCVYGEEAEANDNR
jgi:hypothetical protein